MKNRKQILVVDDVTTNLRFIGEILKDDYSLSMTKSGKQALKLLEKVTPDLILLDIKMPEMDGYETYAKIKEIDRIKDVPTIFLTSDTEEDSKIRGFRMGIADFICKPFEPDLIRSRIGKILDGPQKIDDVLYFTYKDPDTNLWNRKYLESMLCGAYKGGESGFFVLFNLNNIVNLNEKKAVVSGNLKSSIAAIILERIGKEDIAALIGGDEIAVFVKSIEALAELESMLKELLTDIVKKTDIKLKDQDKSPIVFGVSQMPYDGCNFHDLYNKADKAIDLLFQNIDMATVISVYDKESIIKFRDNLSQLDIYSINNSIEVDNKDNGPMFIPFDSFIILGKFLKRMSDRIDNKSEYILFTLKKLKISEADFTNELNNAMKGLEIVIRDSLRKNDIVSKCGENQFVILLNNIDKSNENAVISRICENYESTVGNNDFLLKFEVDDF